MGRSTVKAPWWGSEAIARRPWWYFCPIATAGRMSATESIERDNEEDERDAGRKLRTQLPIGETKEADRRATELISRYSRRIETTRP